MIVQRQSATLFLQILPAITIASLNLENVTLRHYKGENPEYREDNDNSVYFILCLILVF